MYDNPLGVMTNSPEFNWHLQNLRQYIGLKSQPFAPTEWSNLPLSAFGQGSGSMGLPGFHSTLKICAGSIWQTKHSRYR